MTLEVKHVYLRQIEIGLGRNVALWLDDNLFQASRQSVKNLEWLSTVKFNCFDKNIRVVLKQHSITAAAWVRSIFF